MIQCKCKIWKYRDKVENTRFREEPFVRRKKKKVLHKGLSPKCRIFNVKFPYFALGSLTFSDYYNFILNQCYTEQINVFLTIVSQLSKCLKFEAVWGVLTDQII